MCGIAGIFGKYASRDLLINLLRPISHRGEKYYQNEVFCLEKKVAIGMHRLAIVNENSGKQPYINHNKTLFCVFNGEIYNYKELQKSLMPFFNFELNSEVEVISKAYIHWGVDFVKRLDGKFAIAIVDLTKEDLLLIRDPMGIKPLYLQKYDDSWLFASEIKALVNIKQYKGDGEIISLNPGSYWYKGKATKYYTIPSFNPTISSNFDQIPILKQILEKAVKKRIPNNATSIACLLSGGIDSSIVTYIAKKIHPCVIAYTLNMHGEESPDYLAAKSMCEKFNIKHVIVSPSIEEIQEFYLEYGVFITESFEPILVRNAVSYYFVCKQIAKDGFKYALTGEGADELFGGYDFIRETQLNKQDILIKHSLDIISQTYLQMADRASMYATLEIRIPFMDKEFVNYSINLPRNYRISSIENKIALRRMYKKNIPNNICKRIKVGMNHGSGFGVNSSSESIYYKAIKKYYANNPNFLSKDLETTSLFSKKFTLNIQNIEEVYNFSRYVELGYYKYINSARLQLNGKLRKDVRKFVLAR